MLVYQTDPNGVFVGVTYADPDPMQPGEWLLPGGCVQQEPPATPEGYDAVFTDAWYLVPTTVVTEAPAKTLEDIRASTSLDRAAFCNGLADAGVISDNEAIAAARGEWPASFAGFLDYLTAAQRRDAQITWASCVTVQRNHEFVVSLAWWTNMEDTQLDALFGI